MSCALCGRPLDPEERDGVLYDGQRCHIECVERDLAERA
jgi:hypothetical protein